MYIFKQRIQNQNLNKLFQALKVIVFTLITHLFVNCTGTESSVNNEADEEDSLKTSQTSEANKESDKKEEGIVLVKLNDPLENAFSVDMPMDWYTKIGLERPYGIIKSCGVAISPDQKTRIFFGDPTLPTFTLPMPSYGFYEGMTLGSPLQVVSSYINPNQFFENYAKMAYSKYPGFKINSVEPNTELQKIYSEGAQKVGFQARIIALTVTFEFDEGGEKRIGKINGISSLAESIWTAEVNGFTTTEAKSEEIEKCLTTIVKSYKTNPVWREKENRAHEERMRMSAQASANYMNQMTQAHNQRMANMQSSFNAHQQRMGNLQAGYDAHNQTYLNSQTSSDNQHRRTIDAIRGEETVRQGNQTAKVEAGYNNYYINSSNNSYYGTNSEPGYVPDGYEKWDVEK